MSIVTEQEFNEFIEGNGFKQKVVNTPAAEITLFYDNDPETKDAFIARPTDGSPTLYDIPQWQQ